MENVLIKPLYYYSLLSFILTLILLLFSPIWAVVNVLALICVWSRVPGFIHYIFNRLALNDFFTFIVAVSLGGWIGVAFGTFVTMFARIFGPYEYFPYTLRATIAISIAALFTPLIVAYTGSANWVAFLLYETVMYFVYYLLVIVFWREEIGLELALIPAVIFFDYALNSILLQLFGTTIANMLTGNIQSGWPFIIFAGLLLGLWMIVKNGNKIAKRLVKYRNRLKLDENKFIKKLEKTLQN